MRATSTDTIRNLVDTVSERRLRAFVVEIAASALRCLTTGAQEPKAAAPTSTDKKRRHWSPARRSAHNAKRREQRAASAAGSRRRRNKAGKPSMPAGNGAGVNGASALSAAALWKHAAKLEPKAPWRAVVRELGVSDSAAQFAHRDQAMPPNVSPAAAARFLTL